MCVDFKDLNQACPKDSFPLFWIHLLVDSTNEHVWLSFLDAFFRIQPYSFGDSRLRKDNICYGPIVVLLQGYAI